MTPPSQRTRPRSALQKNEARAGNSLRAFRAGTLHFLDDPDRADPGDACVFLPDGVLVVRSGQVAAVGAARDVIPDLPKETPITHWPDGLIMPGFVDCHVHYPQTEMIAFLGSGLFDLAKAEAARIRVGLGTDVGGGTSLSLLRTMADAYRVARLKNQRLSPLKAFYMATLGGARALGLEGVIGNFLPGKEADFVVLNDAATPLLARRSRRSRNLEDRLFALAILGDDRAVRAVYVMGKAAGENTAI